MTNSSTLYLRNLPMPPSVNQLFAGKGRRYKSDKYKAFEWECDKWLLQNKRLVLDISRRLMSVLNERSNLALDVSYEFHFTYESILTKSNKPKANDTANRIKALEDSLAKMLQIDDKFFWSGRFTKHINLKPHANVCITVVDYDSRLIQYPFYDT